MSEPCPSARRRMDTLARDHAAHFDATLLHNRVYEQLQGQLDGSDDLMRLLDLAERTYDLAADRDEQGDRLDIFGAAEDLNDKVDDFVDEQIAKACAVVELEADDWDDAWDEAEIDAAQFEARQWLSAHPAAAKRAGVWEEVTADA